MQLKATLYLLMLILIISLCIWEQHKKGKEDESLMEGLIERMKDVKKCNFGLSERNVVNGLQNHEELLYLQLTVEDPKAVEEKFRASPDKDNDFVQKEYTKRGNELNGLCDSMKYNPHTRRMEYRTESEKRICIEDAFEGMVDDGFLRPEKLALSVPDETGKATENRVYGPACLRYRDQQSAYMPQVRARLVEVKRRVYLLEMVLAAVALLLPVILGDEVSKLVNNGMLWLAGAGADYVIVGVLSVSTAWIVYWGLG